MKIEHIAIWVNNIEEMKRFYTGYFNVQVGNTYRNHGKGFESCFLSFDSGARLELMKMTSIPENRNDPISQHTGLIHFAISVGSGQAVDELTEKMCADGFQVLDGPRHTGDGYYESVVLDPENNRIEITI